MQRSRGFADTRFTALLLLGLVLRLAALPLPGTGDVRVWKTWSFNAVASGERAMYGVGQHPLEHRVLFYHDDLRFKADYPPVSLFVLGAVGRVYNWFAPGMPDTVAFTAALKIPPLLADLLLAWVILAGARRAVGVERARMAALAWWLNPAALLTGAALGYLDPLFALPSVAALVVASAGQTWLAGGLVALATLTKAQGLLLAPVVALAIVNSTPRGTGRYWSLLVWRVGQAAAGAAAIGLVVLAPYMAAGTLPNLLGALRTIGEHDMLSGQAANVWWIVTWLLRFFDMLPEIGAWRAFTAFPRILGISTTMALGYPNPRVVGLLLMGSAWLWALWRLRKAVDLPLLAGGAAFLVHAYFVLAPQVHENHLYLAIPLAILAAAGRRAWGAVALALTLVQVLNLSLFYGFSGESSTLVALARSITVIDAVVVLSVANILLLGWHAWVLARSCREDQPGLFMNHE